MYSFGTESDIKAFEKFTVLHGGSYLQSSMWPGAKPSWTPVFYSARNDSGELAATCLVMERKVPLAGVIRYIGAGPVCDWNDTDLIKGFTAFLKDEMKKDHACCTIIDPPVILRRDDIYDDAGRRTSELLKECGFMPNSDISTYTYKHPVQMMIDLKDESGANIPADTLLRGCEKGVRYSVRIGNVRGLTAKRYTYEQAAADPQIMKDFASVMHDTSGRNGFVARDSEYCLNLMKAMKDCCDITLVYYDKAQDMALEKNRLIERTSLEQLLQQAPQKKIKGIKNDIEAIDKNTQAYEIRKKETGQYPDDAKIALAGGLTLRYAGTASCLFGGTRDLLRNNTRSSHYLNYLRLCDSIDTGCSYHDLGYVLVESGKPENDGTLGTLVPKGPFKGIYEFKKSFGAHTCVFLGEYTAAGSSFRYFIYRRLMPAAKKMRVRLAGMLRKLKHTA